MKNILIFAVLVLLSSSSNSLELLRGVYTEHLAYSGYLVEGKYEAFQEDNKFLGLMLDNGLGFATMTTSYDTPAKALFKMYKSDYYVTSCGFKARPTLTLGVVHGYPKDAEKNDFSSIYVPLVNPAIRIDNTYVSVNIGLYALDVATIVIGVKF